jgi:hypothetical protein
MSNFDWIWADNRAIVLLLFAIFILLLIWMFKSQCGKKDNANISKIKIIGNIPEESAQRAGNIIRSARGN